MRFIETKLQGAYIIELERMEDERGYFARAWCQKEFQKYDLKTKIAQCNYSFNHKKGTLRGMHYQVKPYEEVKMVRCIQGKILDVIIDLRKNSDTYKEWIGVELSQNNNRMLYVPEGFAHGYQTLEDNAGVFYQVTEFYQPGSEKGIRWNDSIFNIHWPLEVAVISQKDKNHPNYTE